MQSILIEIPGEVASQIKLPPKRAKKIIMEELIIRLYKQGIITAAQGTRLLNMDRLRFECFLAENEIPIHGDPDELDTDIANLEQLL
jgi:predicted HTH domain antitoxin